MIDSSNLISAGKLFQDFKVWTAKSLTALSFSNCIALKGHFSPHKLHKANYTHSANVYVKTWATVKTLYMPFYLLHRGEQCSISISVQFRENTVLSLYSLRKKKSIHLQAFVQRQIQRSECCFKSNCSASFLASPCFCRLFTFWQSLSVFCYFQAVTFHICIYFPVEIVLGLLRLCTGCYSASLFPTRCSSTHLPCCFIPSPHTAEHRLSFLNQG